MSAAMDREQPGLLDTLGIYLARKGRRAWPLTVIGIEILTPHMWRVRFAGDDLGELEWKRGQDFVLEIPHAGSIVRRHYTIRDLDAGAGWLAIDFVLHGDSPAGNWVRNARAGDKVVGVGPRGHTYLRDADWHLFIGDETGMPGIFAMIEGLVPGPDAHAFIEIADDAEKIAIAAKRGVAIHWISRSGTDNRLYGRIEQFAFPAGRGHAYVIGETGKVRAIRHRLLERGLAKDQIAAEGYWRPGRVGGHDHV